MTDDPRVLEEAERFSKSLETTLKGALGDLEEYFDEVKEKESEFLGQIAKDIARQKYLHFRAQLKSDQLAVQKHEKNLKLLPKTGLVRAKTEAVKLKQQMEDRFLGALEGIVSAVTRIRVAF